MSVESHTVLTKVTQCRAYRSILLSPSIKGRAQPLTRLCLHTLHLRQFLTAKLRLRCNSFCLTPTTACLGTAMPISIHYDPDAASATRLQAHNRCPGIKKPCSILQSLPRRHDCLDGLPLCQIHPARHEIATHAPLHLLLPPASLRLLFPHLLCSGHLHGVLTSGGCLAFRTFPGPVSSGRTRACKSMQLSIRR